MMETQSILMKLCWLVEKQRKAEIAYSRAKYQVSYYRKMLKACNSGKEVAIKWDKLKIAKKIECVRLLALEKQKHLLDTRKKLRDPIAFARKKLKARFNSTSGVIVSIEVAPTTVDKYAWRTVGVVEIGQMSDEYEAEQVLTKLLTKDENEQEN